LLSVDNQATPKFFDKIRDPYIQFKKQLCSNSLNKGKIKFFNKRIILRSLIYFMNFRSGWKVSYMWTVDKAHENNRGLFAFKDNLTTQRCEGWLSSQAVERDKAQTPVAWELEPALTMDTKFCSPGCPELFNLFHTVQGKHPAEDKPPIIFF